MQLSEEQLETCEEVLKAMSVKSNQDVISQSKAGKKIMRRILQLQWEKSLDKKIDMHPYKFIRVKCYSCRKPIIKVHDEYRMMCEDCGVLNATKRTCRHDLGGKIAIVTGGRIKLGFAVSLLLLRCGATVIITTRFEQDASKRFESCEDHSSWKDNLIILRADFSDYAEVRRLIMIIKGVVSHVDILINNAAQTIERPDFYYRNLVDNKDSSDLIEATDGFNTTALTTLITEFPDDKFGDDGEPLDLRVSTSWTKSIHEISYRELTKVLSINFLVPYILVKELYELMKSSIDRPSFIVNVSSREGMHHFRKNKTHVHTNAAKASLNMMTETIHGEYAKDHIYVNTVDPGWVSALTPHVKAQTMPLTIEDGAARILDPVFLGMKGILNSGAYFRSYGKSEWKNYDVDEKNVVID